jgi:hypothetical protein
VVSNIHQSLGPGADLDPQLRPEPRGGCGGAGGEFQIHGVHNLRVTRVCGRRLRTRGLHSSAFRLNVSTFCGIGVAFRCWAGGAYEMSCQIAGIFRVYFVSETVHG